MLQKTINSFGYALRGLKTVWLEEINFRIEVLISVIISFCLLYFRFTITESLFCVVAMVVVLSLEIINTALEDLCNFVEPQHNLIIGKIKDTMASFVLTGALGALIVWILVFYNHFS